MDYWLREALQQRAREMGKGYDPATDPSDFPKIYQDIETAANSWFLNSIRIVDIGNWRFKNLIKMDGSTIRIKKPQLLLSVEITSRGDLTLSWYPVSVHKTANYREMGDNSQSGAEYPDSYEYSYGDWLVWDCQQDPGEEWRHNAIIQIRHFAKLIGVNGERKSLPKSEQYLLKALKSLLDNIFGFLEQLVEVEIQDIFTVAESGAGLIGRICSLQEAGKERSISGLKKGKRLLPPKARPKPARKKSVFAR